MNKRIQVRIIRRTFDAKKYPVGSPERCKLNNSVVTSEYQTSYKYVRRVPFYMSDGTLHPQKWIDWTYRTKKEAEESTKQSPY